LFRAKSSPQRFQLAKATNELKWNSIGQTGIASKGLLNRWSGRAARVASPNDGETVELAVSTHLHCRLSS
jgi:hypothetical protein